MKSIGERLQNLRIQSVIASAKPCDPERRVKALEQEAYSLTLNLMAMRELLEKTNGLFLKDLEARIEDIDVRDGKLNGKLKPNPKKCPECNHPLHGRRKGLHFLWNTDYPHKAPYEVMPVSTPRLSTCTAAHGRFHHVKRDTLRVRSRCPARL